MWRFTHHSSDIAGLHQHHHFDLLWQSDAFRPPLHKFKDIQDTPNVDLLEADHDMHTDIPSTSLRDRPFSPFSGYYTQEDVYPSSEYDFFENDLTFHDTHPRGYLLFGEDDPYLYTYWPVNGKLKDALPWQQQPLGPLNRRLSTTVLRKRPQSSSFGDDLITKDPSKRPRLVCDQCLFDPQKQCHTNPSLKYDESLEY
ncbi:hypothetical protein DM01DRAFT_1336160 [Hesseltinella vesiculosa]|uniref:Uncharacterized protein n=1 Tax=Hesseltinella vesiculosa TaxID=101127 RepID=A0A1X2GIB7_9FUNG|nr:hypothetical protein DM01DRAFT_1336160 [Hesseltinella vesiculosa]